MASEAVRLYLEKRREEVRWDDWSLLRMEWVKWGREGMVGSGGHREDRIRVTRPDG